MTCSAIQNETHVKNITRDMLVVNWTRKLPTMLMQFLTDPAYISYHVTGAMFPARYTKVFLLLRMSRCTI